MQINLHPITAKQFRKYRQERQEIQKYTEQIIANDPSTPSEILQEIMQTSQHHEVIAAVARNPNTNFGTLIRLTPKFPEMVANNLSWQLFAFLKPEFTSQGNMPSAMLYLLIIHSQEFTIWHQMASHQPSLACWWQALAHPKLHSESIERIFRKMPKWTEETFSQTFFMWRRLVLNAIINHANTPRKILDILSFDDDPEIAKAAQLETRINSHTWKLLHHQEGVPESMIRSIYQYSQTGQKTILEYLESQGLLHKWIIHHSVSKRWNHRELEIPSLAQVNQPYYAYWEIHEQEIHRHWHTGIHNPWIEAKGFPDITPEWADTTILKHLRKHGQILPDLKTRLEWCEPYFGGVQKNYVSIAKITSVIDALKKSMGF